MNDLIDLSRTNLLFLNTILNTRQATQNTKPAAANASMTTINAMCMLFISIIGVPSGGIPSNIMYLSKLTCYWKKSDYLKEMFDHKQTKTHS